MHGPGKNESTNVAVPVSEASGDDCSASSDGDWSACVEAWEASIGNTNKLPIDEITNTNFRQGTPGIMQGESKNGPPSTFVHLVPSNAAAQESIAPKRGPDSDGSHI